MRWTMPKAPIKRFRRLPDDEQSRVIEMAWEGRTPFEAIETLFGMSEPDVLRGYCPTQYKR
tara:strand:+ start:440 stop:622 length:183 start_codon:yes stop_codon:yes gene_type:complete